MRAAVIAMLAVLLTACGSTSPVASTTPTPSPIGEPTPHQSPLIPCLPTQGGTSSRATIADVRVGTHTGYDRVVVEFTGGMPAYKLDWQDPKTFVGPAKGTPVSVAGVAGLHLYIYGMDIPPAYQHGTNMSTPAYPVLRQVVVLGVYEGQADIAIGLGRIVCPTISTMTGPDRLVLDFVTT
ncbi:MAG TPA: hypothetical protein VFL29_01355 [Candidatus Dormibacteraeota bacterium]|nr:hypothetical protein [Candidatus Dormibacteraeota bacterium]